ncbi:SAM domain (Sterile alpha motif) [Rhizobiales bacterium GAS113]|nr:SAM domain (Sterile alpha motif) [Rhizobiales bacterium GAS113]
MDIADWLEAMGLRQYSERFIENDVDLEALGYLTDQDLKELGVSLGHRRKMLAAIGARGDAATAPKEAPAMSPLSSAPSDIAMPEHGPAERRQVTVLFCDLVGSTAMSARLDPEDMREIIASYQRKVGETVERNAGYVAKYMGDGALVYFGYPRAREDDVECAVRAGLELADAIGNLRTRAEEQLAARIGIATGLVVIGDLVGSGEAQERGIVGDTPNLAARLQGMAEPGWVVIAEGTRRLLGRLFELEDLGAQALKGLARPVQAWRVVRPWRGESRFEALHGGGLTALVGREEEMELLYRRWRRAASGSGQVALVSGEPGIGKSRLVVGLGERIQGEPHIRLHYSCSPQHADSALHPVITQLEHSAGFTHKDDERTKLDKLDRRLARGAASSEDRALIADLLSLGNDGRYPTLGLEAQQRRQRTLAALLAQIEGLAREQPVLLIFEDLHWIDPTSLELLSRTVERIGNLPVLLIMTFRPEFAPPWVGQAYMTSLILNRLGKRDVDLMIQRLLENLSLPTAILAELAARTDGIPLFVEEMTKAVLEAGSEAWQAASAGPSATLTVPATLQASLMARLDRLGPAKEVAQIGAAIGREFSYPLLVAVAQRSETELTSALERLTEAGLVFRQGTPPHASYLFKHALVQDAGYASLLRGRRQEIHARIAHALEESSPTLVAAEPELLAYHFALAGLPDRASANCELAGDRAASRSGYAEAVAHFNTALSEAAKLQPGPERSRRELALLLKLGPALAIRKGPRSPEFEAAYRRAHEHAQGLADGPSLFKATWGLWLNANIGGRFKVASERVQELLTLGHRLQDDELVLEAYHCSWGTANFRGDAATCLRDSREGIERYDPARHARLGLVFGGHDPGVCACGTHGMSLWLAGFPMQAPDFAGRAVDLAETLDHPHSLTHGLLCASLTHQLAGDADRCLALADRLVAVARRYDFPTHITEGQFLGGWARAMQSDVAAGIEQMEVAFVSKLRHYLVHDSVRLAEALCRAEREAEALAVLNRALEEIVEPDTGLYLPELYRLRGELLIRLDPANRKEALSSMRHGLDLATRLGVRALGLRAAVSLVRASGAPRDSDNEASARLRQIYESLTEGFGTPDLVEAKALLDGLL